MAHERNGISRTLIARVGRQAIMRALAFLRMLESGPLVSYLQASQSPVAMFPKSSVRALPPQGAPRPQDSAGFGCRNVGR